MTSNYGSMPGGDQESGEAELEFDETYTTQPDEPRSVFVLALKTAIAVIAFAGISIMAVSVSRSFDASISGEVKSFADFETDVFGRVTYSLLDDDQQESLFKDFITDYSRSYAQQAEEYNKRLAVFKTNLALADVRNAKESAINGSGVHGVTKFSDLTSEEFVSMYLMDSFSRKLVSNLKHEAPRKLTDLTTDTSSDLTDASSESSPNRVAGSDPTLTYIDWSSSITTEVKNAGSCGGSWAIAAVSQVESDAIKEGLLTKTRPLSVQQVLSCTAGQDGCNYGEIEDAYDYIQKPGGLYYVSDYAYTASDGSVAECETINRDYALTIGGWFSLNTDGNAYNIERLMLAHITNTGTLSVCLDATTWSTYVSGTMGSCDGNQINHCVQVVGMYYSSAEDSGFYKIRNSWGTDWGVDGYISLAYGGDLCAISNNPIYSDPVKDDNSAVNPVTTGTTTTSSTTSSSSDYYGPPLEASVTNPVTTTTTVTTTTPKQSTRTSTKISSSATSSKNFKN
jgi:C1A family cysteine protease